MIVMSGFEPHRRPNESKLEVFREEIAEMRALEWPLRKIADWLRTEKSCEVSYEAVRNFCDVRGIVKGHVGQRRSAERANVQAKKNPSGNGEGGFATGRQEQLDRVTAAKKKFTFDSSEPLKVKRKGR